VCLIEGWRIRPCSSVCEAVLVSVCDLTKHVSVLASFRVIFVCVFERKRERERQKMGMMQIIP